MAESEMKIVDKTDVEATLRRALENQDGAMISEPPDPLPLSEALRVIVRLDGLQYAVEQTFFSSCRKMATSATCSLVV